MLVLCWVRFCGYGPFVCEMFHDCLQWCLIDNDWFFRHDIVLLVSSSIGLNFVYFGEAACLSGGSFNNLLPRRCFVVSYYILSGSFFGASSF